MYIKNKVNKYLSIYYDITCTRYTYTRDDWFYHQVLILVSNFSFNNNDFIQTLIHEIYKFTIK